MGLEGSPRLSAIYKAAWLYFTGNQTVCLTWSSLPTLQHQILMLGLVLVQAKAFNVNLAFPCCITAKRAWEELGASITSQHAARASIDSSVRHTVTLQTTKVKTVCVLTLVGHLAYRSMSTASTVTL